MVLNTPDPLRLRAVQPPRIAKVGCLGVWLEGSLRVPAQFGKKVPPRPRTGRLDAHGGFPRSIVRIPYLRSGRAAFRTEVEIFVPRRMNPHYPLFRCSMPSNLFQGGSRGAGDAGP